MAKNNTKLSFLRQGTKTEEGCFVELDESILRRPKEKKKESLEKEIFLDSFSQPVVRESQPRAEYTALAKRNFIGPPTHTGTILYCARVGTRRGEVLRWRRLAVFSVIN